MSNPPPVQPEPTFEIRSRGGETTGPHSLTELRMMFSQGSLTSEVEFRQTGAQDWQRIEVIQGLSGGEGPYPWQGKAAQTSKPGAMDLIAPVRTDVWALFAGYLGLFSVILIAAPLSLIVGIMALKSLKMHPDRTGKGRAWFGLIMGIIFTPLLIWLVIDLVMRPQ